MCSISQTQREAASGKRLKALYIRPIDSDTSCGHVCDLIKCCWTQIDIVLALATRTSVDNRNVNKIHPVKNADFLAAVRIVYMLTKIDADAILLGLAVPPWSNNL